MRGYDFIRGKPRNSCLVINLNAAFQYHLFIMCGILGAGKLCAELVQTKPVVDTLAKNTTHILLSVKKDYVGHAAVISCHGGRHTGRARANNYYIVLLHFTVLLKAFQ